MTYEELLIDIDLKGYGNVLPSVGKTCLNDHWFIVCDDGGCHLFGKTGRENDIRKVKKIYEGMISRSVKKIVIPNNVTSINYGAFMSCCELTSVMIPNRVTSIGNWAFDGCSKLKNVTIPNSVTIIGWKAFENCYKLKSVTIDKPIDQVKAMKFYPWGIKDESIIKCI